MPQPTRRTPDDTLIFLHLVKTGGTTLLSVLRRQYQKDEICLLYRPELVSRYPSRDAVHAFAELPLEKRERYRAISGHMQLGIHDFVPRPYMCATLLRHPVDLCVSAYRYVHREPQTPRHELIRGKDLETVLREGLLPFLDNGQTRALCSTDSASVPYGGCTRLMLDEAKENVVELIELAGTIEEFDGFLLLLKERLGWGKVWYNRRNQDPEGTTESKLPRETREQILAYNHLDLQLYEFVRERFRKRLAEAGPAFESRLRRFRRANAFRSKLQRVGKRP